ncbi:MAG: HAD-IIB family hydrolase [bacterium]|nr:HAD-IIB family hydrolase [bacterium]
MNSISEKDVIIFDLDGTLTEAKTLIDAEMARLISKLLDTHQVAVMSGGSHDQIKKQFVAGLEVADKARVALERIHLFPTCGSQCYQFEKSEWLERYAERLTDREKKEIQEGFEKVYKKIGYKHPDKLYGEVVEDRGTQMTFSAVGQKAPIEEKQKWIDKNYDKREEVAQELQKLLPEHEVRTAGLTSIDVTRKGINKYYGVKKVVELLSVPIERMVFVGDMLMKGGNDEPVIETGIDTVAVTGPEDTKDLLMKWLQSPRERSS